MPIFLEYRSPTYARCASVAHPFSPRHALSCTDCVSRRFVLAQELIDTIADFLWDEPVQLARCCLVCCAWYFAARRHLSPSVALCGRDTLDDLVRILMSKENNRYGQAVRNLQIVDKPDQPYVRTLPMRLPGCHLKGLKVVHFLDLDWAALARPHISFFDYLTSYSSVTKVCFDNCTFRRVEDLRAIADALPNLDSLMLSRIMVRLASDATHLPPRAPTAQLRVRRLTLPHGAERYRFSTDESCPSLPAILLHQLTSYSTVVRLHVDTTQFCSFSQLQHFLRAFPALRKIVLSCDPAWKLPDASLDTVLLPTTGSADVWPLLGLHAMSGTIVLQFLRLFMERYRRYQAHHIMVRGAISSTLLSTVEEMVCHSGPMLRKFSLDIWRPSDEEALPQFPLRVSMSPSFLM